MSIQIYLTVTILCLVGAVFLIYIFCKNEYKEYYSSQLKFDIDLKEMVESEKRLSLFLSDHHIGIEGNIVQDVARNLEIEIGGISDMILNNAELTTINGKKIVILKEGLNDQEKRFCLAHECAHLINGDPVPQTRPEGRDKEKIEQKADYMAAAMILPRKKISQFLMDTDYKNLPPRKRVRLIDQICKEYSVKDVVAMRRIQEVAVLENYDLS